MRCRTRGGSFRSGDTRRSCPNSVHVRYLTHRAHEHAMRIARHISQRFAASTLSRNSCAHVGHGSPNTMISTATVEPIADMTDIARQNLNSTTAMNRAFGTPRGHSITTCFIVPFPDLAIERDDIER